MALLIGLIPWLALLQEPVLGQIAAKLWTIYLPLVGWIGLGVILGRSLPRAVPLQLGKFLFWIGVPFSIVAFLRQADLSAALWAAPTAAWAAILLGAGFGWIWLKSQSPQLSPAAQGSFLLGAMVGNTGYLGYPIVLALVGTSYFGWAVFYDTLGSALGSYGLGVVLAAYFGGDKAKSLTGSLSLTQLGLALVRNPALWSFGLGLGLKNLTLPNVLEQSLARAAWGVVALSLLLLGMRLSQVSSWQSLKQASVGLCIKMVIVPLILGYSLPYLGIHGLPRLTIVLQAAMPPAFATLVIAEAYSLERQLTVTMLAAGSLLLLALLPIWLLLFSA